MNSSKIGKVIIKTLKRQVVSQKGKGLSPKVNRVISWEVLLNYNSFVAMWRYK
jgi:hypothetical protein